MPKNKGKPHQEWFKQAQYDLETAEAMFQTGRYIYTVFMCHLCIEKALKGLYMQEFKEEPPKIHDLIYFSEKIELKIPKKLGDFLDTLNDLSVPTRYPEDLQKLLKEYNSKETQRVLLKAKELLKWLKQKLEK